MPRYRYRCAHGCSSEGIGGKPLGAHDVERTVPVSEMDSQACAGCGNELSRVWDTSGLHLHWPYHMSQNVTEEMIGPSSPEARARWDEYVD